MKKLTIFSLLIAGMAAIASCSYDRSPGGDYDPNDPGFEYAPEGDMYYSVPYQPMTQYDENNNPYNKDSMNMALPVNGTIARGHLSYYYPYPNNNDGYARAAELRNPLSVNAENIARGKMAFETYCWQCHGSEATPKGSLVAAGKFPPPTWSFERLDLLKTLPEGQMFHSITFGRNLMGPHGPIVTPDDRWKIIMYLKKVATGSAASAPAAAPADSTNTASK